MGVTQTPVQIQTKTQVQTKSFGELVWEGYYNYIEAVKKRLKEELEKRGVEVHDIYADQPVDMGSYIKYGIVVEVALRKTLGVYYDGLYESCQEGVEGLEVDEDNVEEEVEKCVEELINSYDEEYGEPPFSLSYDDGVVTASVTTFIDDDGYVREYIDGLVIKYRSQYAKWVFAKFAEGVSEDDVSYEVEQIIAKVEQLIKAVQILMEQ